MALIGKWFKPEHMVNLLREIVAMKLSNFDGQFFHRAQKASFCESKEWRDCHKCMEGSD